MPADDIVQAIDFRYITDALTPAEALEILRRNDPTKGQREAELRRNGYPAYTTSVGWLGYSDEKIRRLCREALSAGADYIVLGRAVTGERDPRTALQRLLDTL